MTILSSLLKPSVLPKIAANAKTKGKTVTCDAISKIA
jgi:hypothetical protein